MPIGAAQFCVCGIWSIALRLLGRDAWLSAMAQAVSGLGKVVWHPALHIRNYQLGRGRRKGSGQRVTPSASSVAPPLASAPAFSEAEPGANLPFARTIW